MRQLLRLLLLVLLTVPQLAHAAQPQAVSFASPDGTQLSAWVFQPEGKSKGTVVALHGCGGLYAALGSRKGQLNARHQAMADLLLTQGYAVVFPDSFTARGVSGLCLQKMSQRSIDQTERRIDALAALNWVGAQPWAMPSAIALLGWSHGGSAVLSATDATHSEVMAHGIGPAVAIAFYPGCSAARKGGYQPNTRLLMLLGALDDWTPPGPCVEWGKTVGAEVHVYPDSYHDFDNPLGSVKLMPDIPNGVYPGRGVHAGPNPAARELAYARLLEVLRAAFE
ncbi:MAG: dienelactone hydrolase family protein [Rhodoferax sp.]